MMRHDLHTHTPYSDGSHSIPLQVLLARAMELQAIAFTDHYFPERALGESDEILDAYEAEIRACRAECDDILVLTGAEAQVLDSEGSISIPANVAHRLEWVLCDLGGLSEGTLKNTPADKRTYADNVLRAYLKLCDYDFIDGIAHPFNTGKTDPVLLPADFPEKSLRELAQKMAVTNTVFDVMNLQMFWFQGADIEPRELTQQYAELVRLFAGQRVVFQVSSDDHRCGIGNTRWSEKVLQMAEVPDEQIISLERLRTQLRQ